jgi:hypothetical protein
LKKASSLFQFGQSILLLPVKKLILKEYRFSLPNLKKHPLV